MFTLRMRKKQKKVIVLVTFVSLFAFTNFLFNNFYQKDLDNNIKHQEYLPKVSAYQDELKYFKYYKSITIDHNKVSGTENLIDFPLLISIFDTNLLFHAQSDGDDIAFSDGSSWLDHEIEEFNQNYNATHAQLIAWVRIPSLSPTTDTKIYMYYGNSTMTSRQNPNGVWNSNYVGVWHLGETSGDAIDSTSYATNGTISSGATQGESGQVDGAYDFNGVNEGVSIGNPGDGHLDFGSTTDFTISLWLNVDQSTSTYQMVLWKGGHSDSSVGYTIMTDTTADNLGFYISDGKDLEYGEVSITFDQWMYFVGVVDRQNDLLHVYKNGTEIGSGVDVKLVGSIDNDYLLAFSQSSNSFDGLADEIRISTGIRSADWIATEYQNQYDPDSFYMLGAEISHLKPEYFKYYKEITIDHTKVSGSSDLFNFPLLISIFDSDLHNYTQSDGDDIAFYDGNDWLDYEIEVFNQDYNASHAKFISWVRIPSLSPTTDTRIYMYYGNSTMEAQENPECVWDNNYVMVQHLHETSGAHYDSTKNNNDGTPYGGLNQDAIGKIDGADDFDGSNDQIDIDDSSSLNITNAITIEAWINVDVEDRIRIVTKGGERYVLRTQYNGDLHGYLMKDSTLYHAYSQHDIITTGTYQHVILTWDGVAGDNQLRLFLNGYEVSYDTPPDTLTGSLDTSDLSLFIGSHESGEWWDGKIDEVRISNIARSANWIATEYSNQYNPNSFYTISTAKKVKPPSVNDFQYYKEIRIDHTKVSGSSNLINFPLLISIFDSDLHEYAQADGDDIVFHNGTEWLDHEIELFNQTYNSTHAQLVAWVRIPSLSPSVDTNITMYYGNSTMESRENPTGVWDENYIGVWHLSEDPTETIYDSTLYSNEGSSYGSMDSGDQILGKIDGSINFDGNDDNIATEENNLLAGRSSFTMSAWIKPQSSSQLDFCGIIEYDNTTDGSSFDAGMELRSDGKPRVNIWTTSGFKYVDSSVVLPTTEFTHFVFVYDGDLNIYLDGSFDSSTPHSGNVRNNHRYINIGRNTHDGRSFNGTIDEIHISNINRSADWISTEYNNQKDATSFYTISTAKKTVKVSSINDFQYYKEITIDHTKVSGSSNLINFPLLISIFDTDLRFYVQPDGDDIAFHDGNGWLDHEIEVFNQTYNSTHAKLIAWVRIPSLSPSVDTNITMYYGNSTMTSHQNPTGVWDSNFKGVWHLSEDPSDSSPQMKDSTSNTNHGTVNNLDTDNQISGQIDGSINFTHNQDYINCTDDSSLNVGSDSFSLSLWLNYDGVDNGFIAGKGAYIMGIRYSIWIPDTTYDKLRGEIDDGTNYDIIETSEGYDDNIWHHVVLVRDGNYLRFYIDGQEITGSPKNITGIGSLDNTQPFFMNTLLSDPNGSPTTCSSVKLDEVRVSNSAHSAEWIATEFSNQNNTNSFYTISSSKKVNVPSINDFQYYKEITIDNAKVSGSSNLINFPLLISIFDADLHDNTQPDGDDIAFHDGNGWLDHEIEVFNQTYNSTHAQLIAWVRIPSLSYLVDTNIKMYYGNSTMKSIENPTGVWNENYKGVWHLKEDPTDSAPQFKDSTLNHNDGIADGDSSYVPIKGDGKIDGSLEFDDSNERCVNISHDSSLQLSADMTISVWIKTSDLDADEGVILAKWSSTEAYRNYWIGKIHGADRDDDTLNFYVDNTHSVSINFSLINDGEWHYITAIADSTATFPTLWLFVDAVPKGMYLSWDGDSVTGDANLQFGRNGVVDQEWNGGIDEVRISNAIHTTEWIETEFSNQNDPNNFYQVGPQISTGEDIEGPILSGLYESADPLELGLSETIQIDVADFSPIDTVLIEIGGTNYTMSYVSGDTYEYTGWTPSSTGIKSYTIYANDTNGNLSFLSDSITVIDNTDPSLSGLSESADPLELGLSETIQIDVTDLSPIDMVLIEIGGTNYTMNYVSGDTYEYTGWTPSSTGIKSYTIYANDTSGNLSFLSDSITVIDTTDPSLSGLSESADPLELGLSETIQIDVTDLSPIDTVLIEIGGTNYTMSYVSGDTYEYTAWTPSSTGIKSYTIYANDTSGNLSFLSDSITVIDTTDPSLSGLSESADPLELGLSETIQIDVTDLSPIDTVLIEIEGTNYTMSYVSGDTYEYTGWTPSSTGIKSYTIYANDTSGNLSFLSDSITVIDIAGPALSGLSESADPLELGDTETIQIDAYDGDGVDSVWIEIEGTNYTMSYVSGDTYEYAGWTPSSTGIKSYTIYANDTSGNLSFLSDSITVTDTTDPSLSGLSESADPLELGLSETIQIDVTDLSPIATVLIEIGSTNYTMSYVSGDTYEYTGWTPSSTGIKSYTIYANDTSGNLNFLSDSITVIDTTDPSLSGLSESADPLELGLSETIQIDVTDLSPIDMVLIEIDGTNYTMSYVSGDTYEYTGWTPSSTGIKSYTIYANDTSGNMNFLSDSITVIDITGPDLSGLSESADPLELGLSETIQIDAYDEDSVDAVWIEIAGINYTMSHVSGDTYEYTGWTPSSTGIKSYTIYANDTDGNLSFLSDSITIIDSTDPNLSGLSESADPLELGLSETIQIDVTDLSPIDTVLIEIAGTNYTMSYVSGDTYEYTGWTPSSTGIKSYTIYANDTSGNLNFLSDSITVIDTTDPSLSGLSESADPLELGLSETIQIDVTDLSPIDTVLIEIEGTNYTMSHVSGDTYEYSGWTPSSTGIKSYTIYANDTSGNMNFLSDTITVTDTTAPEMSGLYESADPLELGLSETILIDIVDFSPIDMVLIEIEGTNYTMGYAGGDSYIYAGWIPSSTGIKSYTIYANDTSGNLSFLSDSITVIDTTDPSLSGLSESADPLELGLSETIQIDVTDLSPIDTVLIEIGGTNYTMSYVSGDTYEYTGWTPSSTGIKSYTIYANDTSGNMNFLSDSITVIDSTGPDLSGLSESADPLEFGSSETIQVDVTDLSPIDTVLIEIGGTNYTMSYVSGDTYEHTGWTPSSTGIKSYKIYANDTSGNLSFLSNSITVIDTTDPSLSGLSESVDPLELGLSETIQIDVTDLSPIDTVLIEIAGTNYTMSYVSGDTYEYAGWTPSSTGIKSYTIYANDTSGNLSFLSDSITVVDTTDPSLSGLSESADPLELGLSETIQIDVTDLSPIDTVLIEIEGTNYTMSHVSGDTYEYASWIPSSTGIKIYTIYANDTSGNLSFLSDSITVVDTTDPSLSGLSESADPLELGLSETIQIDVTDLSPIDTVLIEIAGANYTMSHVSGDTYEYSGWTPSTSGIKPYTIYANDTSGNMNFLSDSITVIDITGPDLSGLSESADPLELGGTETIQIDAYDSDGVDTVWIEIAEIEYIMSYVSGDTYEYTGWIPNSTGIKSYTIYANDTSGNLSFLSDSITVIDITDPSLSGLSESADPLELGLSETIQIDVTDLSPIDMVLIEIEGNNYTMSHVSGDTYEFAGWIPSSTGIKSYTIYANDTSGNLSFLSDSITVIDTTDPSLSGLSESADPLELGLSETIQIDVTDLSPIDTVLIEIEGNNYTMSHVSGDTYEYSGWTPSSTGIKSYTIYANDTSGNMNFLSDSITVIDITGPALSGLSESADPLELGGTETIQIDAYDGDGVDAVWIEISGTNYTMSHVSGDTYEYTSWIPSTSGIKSYTIYANDTNGNLSYLSNSITVIDTIDPSLSGLSESADPLELGLSETIQIDVTDLSPIDTVLIEIEGTNYTMSHVSGDTYEYAGWTPSSTGIKSYTIYANDTSGNLSFLSDSITVIDTTDPGLSGLSESADPLELGLSETIQIDVTDLSPIDTVLIEIGGTNYTMSYVSGDTYEYTGWTPSSTGIKSYTIYANDTSGNMNFLSDTITVTDTTDPSLSGLFESADPLELGSSETILIDIVDFSPIDMVLIEIEGTNYTMGYAGGDTYIYAGWIPSSTGIKSYTIYANDSNGNLSFLSDSITVIDTTDPGLSGLSESADPLELGLSETIQIDVTDLSPIDTVLIEISGTNYTMNHVSGNTYEYTGWTPTFIGIKSYTIYANDTSGNINFLSNAITVIDTTAPSLSGLYESADPLELGLSETIQIDVTDFSPIDTVLIEIEGTNYTMSHLSGDTYEYAGWTPSSTGIKSYTIYANDSNGNSNSLSDTITVEDISVPIITILSPDANSVYSILAPNFSLSFNPSNITDLWYTIDGGFTNFTFTGNNGTINQTAWDAQIDGNVTIQFFINNTLGVIGFNEVMIIKDTLAPQITINFPSNNTYYGVAPIFNVLAIDANLNVLWYRINTYNVLLGNNINQQLETAIWDDLPDGEFNVYIYANDTAGNLNYSVSVTLYKDTVAPSKPILMTFPQGKISGTIVFEWQEGSDPSGISKYRLIIDNEENPFATPGFIFEINTTANHYEYTESLQPGTYFYFLYQIDGTGHQSSASTGSFTIESTTPPSEPPEFPIWIIFIIIGAAIGGIVGVVILKKSKGKEIKLMEAPQEKAEPDPKLVKAEKMVLLERGTLIKKSHNELKAREKELLVNIQVLDANQSFTKAAELLSEVILIEEIFGNSDKATSYRQIQIDTAVKGLDYLKNEYEIESKKVALSGDYSKSLKLYKESQIIAENLKTYLQEQKSPKSEELLSTLPEVQSELVENVSMVYSCINDLLTKYFDEIGIKYYSNLQIYDNISDQIHGLILADQYNIEDVDPLIRERIKSIQIIFIDNLSTENVAKLCQTFYNQHVLLFLVGIKWPKKLEAQMIELPANIVVEYPENIKIIHYELFIKLIGLTGAYETAFKEIIGLFDNLNIEILRETQDSSEIIIHGTDELRYDLKEKGLNIDRLEDYFNS